MMPMVRHPPEGFTMRKAYLLSLLLVAMFLVLPLSPISVGATGDSVDETITDDVAIVDEGLEEQVLKISGKDTPYYDLNDLVDMGAATRKVIPMETFNGLEDLYDLNRNSMILNRMPTRADSGKDENDDYSNATSIDDGDSVDNNVTSTIVDNVITFNDQDFYLVNLTVDGANNTVDRPTFCTRTRSSMDTPNGILYVLLSYSAWLSCLEI